MNVGSLFSGIGGMDYGLEMAGFDVQWQVEIDPYCRKVLAKNWPHVNRFEDVRDVGRQNLSYVDLIAGGFPCQDISNAGPRIGISGKRSGLWSEFSRVIGELRPKYVLVENVDGLLRRGMGRVLGDLSEHGYDAEWAIIPAAAIGAPHIRKRVFILAYPNGVESKRERRLAGLGDPETGSKGPGREWERVRNAPRNSRATLANADFQSLEVGKVFGENARSKLAALKRDCSTGAGIWSFEPAICRVADRIPHRVDRIRGIGNSCVPKICQLIGELINELELLEKAA